MIGPKNETKDFLLSVFKNCDTLTKQTHRKLEETMEFKLTKSRETFHFNPSIEVKEDWMIGLISLEVYHSVFNITEKITNFEIYTGVLEDEFSKTQLKDKVAEVLGLSDVSPGDLELEIHGKDFSKI